MESNKQIEAKEHRSKIVEGLMQGHTTSELIDLVRIYSPIPLSEKDIRNKINDARGHLEEMTEIDSQKMVAIHIGWYEEIYKYFHEIQHVEGMNKVMRAKERLLGLHKRDNKLIISQKNTINVTRKVEYDFSRLSEPQRIRLQELMDKMK